MKELAIIVLIFVSSCSQQKLEQQQWADLANAMELIFQESNQKLEQKQRECDHPYFTYIYLFDNVNGMGLYGYYECPLCEKSMTLKYDEQQFSQYVDRFGEPVK